MTKRNASRTPFRFLALLGLLLLGGCSFGEYNGSPDPEPPPQTEILGVRMQPDTVMTGDTMLVHCVIRDSLDHRFVFDWDIDPGSLLPVNETLTGTKIRWVAPTPSQSGVTVYGATVSVDNGSEDSTEVVEVIDLPVMKPAATP